MGRAAKVGKGGLHAFWLTAVAIVRRDKKLLTNLTFFWILAILFLPIALFPGWFGEMLAKVLAYPILRISRTDKRITRNLDLLFGEGHGVDPHRIGLSMAREYVGIARNKFSSPEAILRRYILTDSARDFATEWEGGQDMILISGHFGRPQDAVSALAAVGVSFFVPTEPLQPGEYSDLVNWLRQPPRCSYEPISSVTVLKARRYMRGPDRLMPGFLFDRVPKGSGRLYRFCRANNEFGLGPALLARKTGAYVYFGVAVDEGIGKPAIHIDGPIVPQVTDDEAADIDYIMMQLISYYEAWVRQYPEQLIGAAQMRILSDEEVENAVH